MNNRSRVLAGMIALASVAAVVPAASLLGPVQPAQSGVESGAAASVMPRYDGDGALLLPQDWRRWTFAGASLGLSYAQGGERGMEMFHETLMEPTAYQHFAETGTFREGTMFALVLHGIGEGVLPARRGRFAGELHGVEMAVKDSTHRPEGWAYYNFGGMNGMRKTAKAMPKDSCYSCHIQHAKRDNVFLQFYPLLEDVAPRPVAAHAAATPQPPASSVLAIKGLDPVLLVAGQEEMGKPEIIAVHQGYRYQFVSEPHRVKFESEPQTYAIRLEALTRRPSEHVKP